MSQQVTNQKASQALNGTATLVTLNGSDSQYLADFTVGDLCTYDLYNITGTINRIDSFGNSFSVNPIQPNDAFGIYGYLAAGHTVTVTY